MAKPKIRPAIIEKPRKRKLRLVVSNPIKKEGHVVAEIMEIRDLAFEEDITTIPYRSEP